MNKKCEGGNVIFTNEGKCIIKLDPTVSGKTSAKYVVLANLHIH
jgi:hypothetical protein